MHPEGGGAERACLACAARAGLADPVYAEAYVTVHQYDIVLDVSVINRTGETLQARPRCLTFPFTYGSSLLETAFMSDLAAEKASPAGHPACICGACNLLSSTRQQAHAACTAMAAAVTRCRCWAVPPPALVAAMQG
jgi:hypothetical protein